MDFLVNSIKNVAKRISTYIVSLVEESLLEEQPHFEHKGGLCNAVGCYHHVCCGFCEKKYAKQLPLSRWVHRYIFWEPTFDNIQEPVNALSSLGMTAIYVYHISTSDNTILEMLIRSYLIINGFCSYLYHRYLYNFFGILDSGSMISPIFIGSCYYIYYLPISRYFQYAIMSLFALIHIVAMSLDSFGSTTALFRSLIFYASMIFGQLYYLNYYFQKDEFWSITLNLLCIIGSVVCQKIDLGHPSPALSRFYLHTIWHLSIAFNVEWILAITDRII